MSFTVAQTAFFAARAATAAPAAPDVLSCLLLLCFAVGRVNHVGHDYVSCLVFDLFNASIAVEQMRKDFKPRPQVCMSGKFWQYGTIGLTIN